VALLEGDSVDGARLLQRVERAHRGQPRRPEGDRGVDFFAKQLDSVESNKINQLNKSPSNECILIVGYGFYLESRLT
jgi:hypothetical protein